MEHTSKRELIEAALKELGEHIPPSRRWALKRAIVHIAQDAKRSHFQASLVSRASLKDELRDIWKDLLRVRERIGKPGVKYALLSASILRNEETDLPPEYRALEDIDDTLAQFFSSSYSLAISTQAAIENLQLKGQRGNTEPFEQTDPGPKLQLAAFGEVLFWIATNFQKTPGINNSDLQSFLSLLWEIATGEEDSRDWSTQLRHLRGKRVRKEVETAIGVAQSNAIQLGQDVSKWEAWHHSLKKT